MTRLTVAGVVALALPLFVAVPAQAVAGGRPDAPDRTKVVSGEPVAVRPRIPDPATVRPGGKSDRGVTPGSPIRLAVTAGKVSVNVKTAYGGDYGSRLRLVQLPECALTTPELAQCRTRTPLKTSSDARTGMLSAEVTSTGTSVLAAVAAAESDKGDYKATPLSASATWTAGGNSGDFSWSYPLRVPPVPGGLAPDLAITYSSASVDGRTSNTNNQPSWVGEGFDLSPGFIERSYKPCADDGAPKNNGADPGDLCWAYDNATVTWKGHGGELIKASDGTWRATKDDGTRYEHLTGTTNGDNDGEYWKATTTDGTQYFFGRHRLPGWASGNPETSSAWTVPVFGDDGGEPCNNSGGFAQSWCQQAWRWNLDQVVDPDGNAITYYYTAETNKYGRNVSFTDNTTYQRGGYLERIEYGLRSGALFAAPPARVVFGTAERCVPDAGFDCAASKISDNPEKWHDVPWDQNCADNCTRDGKFAPTFWTRKRLTGVTTQIRKADGTYRDIEGWALSQAWGDADIDQALLLASIEHMGKGASPAVTLPKVTFNHVQLMNRVDKSGDDIPPFIRYRIGAIFDESGGQIDVDYSSTDCTLDDLPAPETNTRRCYPVYWQPPGHDNPIRDWFYKYVVTRTIVSDRTALAPDMVTDYAYEGGAAWHYDDDDGLTREKYKTWSQWRGYRDVRVITAGKARVDHRFLRGMDGDRLNASGGAKSVSVPDDEGGSTTDHNSLAGLELQTTTYTGPSGTVDNRTVNTPWHAQTASRTRSWGTTTADLTGVATTRTWQTLDGGARRQTRTDTTYEPVAGLPTVVDDQGDVAVATDDLCTRSTYAVNAGAWLRAFPAREETVSVRCSGTPDRTRQVVSDVRSFYDGGVFGAAPTKGHVTRAEKLAAHDGTSATYVATARTAYDGVYGRPLTVTDALGNITTNTYTETAGLTTQTTQTGPPVVVGNAASAHTSAQTLDPAWGLPLTVTDAGGKVTTLAYDALGRSAKVWLPDRPTTSTPNLEFAYRITEGEIVAVTTKTLTPAAGQRAAIQLYDGLLRPRQNQAEGPGGGRLLTDTFYDERGLVGRTYESYYATGAPAPTLFGVAVPGDVEAQHAYAYDGLGRVTVERFLVGNNDTQEKWRTVTAYGGDWTTIDPPDGGTPTAQFTDGRGRVTERRQFRGTSPTGAYDQTRYAYTADGKLTTVTDTAGAVWTHAYDVRGREITTVDPDHGTTISAYDDLDRLTSVTDGRGKKLFHTYDPLGRRIETREGTPTGTLRASWLFDTVRKGQPTSATRYAGGQPYTTRIDVYDNLNRPVRRSVVIPSTEGALAGTYTFSTAYNLDGTVQSSGFPAAGGLAAENVVTTYDATARATRLTGNLGAYVNASTYALSGQLLQRELTTGVKKAWQTFTWEYGTRRLASTRVDREGVSGVDSNATYSYTPAGTITAISDVSRSGTETQCFGYDYAQHLTEAWTQSTTTCAAGPSAALVGGPSPYWSSYAYDAAGSRTSETLHGASDTSRAYTNQGHRLTRVDQSGGAGARTDTFGYDATGNLTSRSIGGTAQTLTWDTGGELSSVTQGSATTSFVYNADGGRMIRRDPSGTTLYLPGTELRLASGASAPSGTRYYSHGEATVAMRTVTGVTFLAGDHQGTSQLAINATTQALAQRRFTPFGADRGTPTGTWPDEKAFVGGTRDPSTGLTHLGAREYDPAVGRFVSVDPVLDPNDPAQLHAYVYARGNPVTLSDPSGRCPVDLCGIMPGINAPKDAKPKNATQACGNDLDCRNNYNNSHDNHKRPSPRPGPPVPQKPAQRLVGPSPLTLLGDHPINPGNALNSANWLADQFAQFSTSCGRGEIQIICYGYSPALDGKPITIGDVFFYPHSEPELANQLSRENTERDALRRGYGEEYAKKYGPDLLSHEAVHSRQWASYKHADGYAMAYAAESIKSYVITFNPWERNRFEQEANLYWGGYLVPPDLDRKPSPSPGPHP
ncbi:RHS repeat-associated core domain-containing protein [Nonomuraea sp. NPDC050556]|uniref:RHS repeat-associated core domain-containing protein n=1 Tax=Nonomuraea sp. NPDC050556 TaxID=3364369 RepID=UPI0037B08691